MSYFLFYPTKSAIRLAGFERLVDVPAIFDRNWKFQRIASRYLRQRGNGVANLHQHARAQMPTKKSMNTFGRHLIDFLTWCDWAKCPWEKVEYVRDLIHGYQDDMLSGAWSTTGNPLAPSTVNGRVAEATRFCAWAMRSGLRQKAFDVPFEISYRKAGGLHSHSHRTIAVSVRQGIVRPHPRDLTIPSEEQVAAWLKGVQIKKGKTISLMCRLVIETGIRREECAQWDRDYLSTDPKKWIIKNGYVLIKLKYGTKGKKYADSSLLRHPETYDDNYKKEVGPRRTIYIPLETAWDLHNYRNTTRNHSLIKYIRKEKNGLKPKERLQKAQKWDRLFISEYDGRPIQGETLRKAFKVQAPYIRWHTHLARHYYACMKLLSSLRDQWRIEASKEEKNLNQIQPPPDWILYKGEATMLMLKKQLGHIDSKTTEAYLVWLLHAFAQSPDYIEALEKNHMAKE